MPSRFGAGAHLMLHEIGGTIHEVVDDGTDTWRRLVRVPVHASLTPDSAARSMYIERPSLDVAFIGPAHQVATDRPY